MKIQYVPDEQGLDACFEFGQKIGQAVLEQESAAAA
jgi:hypothetical protein